MDLSIGNAFLDQILAVDYGLIGIFNAHSHFNLANKQLLVLSPLSYLTGSVGYIL